MPRKPNVRKAKEAPTSTQKAKEFSKKSQFKSEGERRYGLARQISKEAEALQSDVSSKQGKAKQQSLWASIGGALGGLALGVVTGGAHWAIQGAAVGIGSAIGGRGGKQASESKKWGGKGKIGDVRMRDKEKGTSERFLFYDEKAKAQESAFKDFDTSLNKSIAQRSMMAGVFAGAMAGGAKAFGEYSQKIKAANEAKKVASAPIAGVATPASTVATSGATSVEAIDRTAHLTDTLSMGAEAGVDMSSLKLVKPTDIVNPGSTSSMATLITPASTEAAPTLFSGFNKSMSDTMKKYTLASGAYSIASYRPELQSLQPMVTMPSNKRYG
tara:strand:- start:1888 stop:2871 length:984 start_codon:yes stop_codon:yes gene_type:complete